MQLGSDEWLAAWWHAARANGTLRTATASWNHGPISLRIEGAPDGVPAGFVFNLANGQLASITPWAKDQLTPFAITLSYDRLKAVLADQLDVVDGVIQGKLAFVGDLPALRRHSQLFNSLVASAAELTTEYPEPAEAVATS